MASGWRAFTSPMTHSQNGGGLVCGLSTRKMRTPCSIQWKKTERSAAQSDARGGPTQAPLEPLGMLLHVGMVGRALEGDVERHLDPALRRRLHEPPEVRERAQL